LGEFVEGKPQQPLPKVLASREADLNAFQNSCNNLMLRILTLFAIGLEVSSKKSSPIRQSGMHFTQVTLQVDPKSGGKDWFSSRHRGGPSGCTLRLLKYPSLLADIDFNQEVDIRAGAHSDYGSITLLFQRPGQPGLEIIPPSSQIPGQRNTSNSAPWMPVPVSPPGTESDPSPPILVNIGDLLSYWTNNLFKSTVHRVVFPKGAKEGGEDRYSIAYFGHPVAATVLEPVPSEMVSALKGAGGVGPDMSKPITANEHLMSRLKATYLDLYKDGEGEKETGLAA
jgi:isopenicillin N synthase-like dioxygenase